MRAVTGLVAAFVALILGPPGQAQNTPAIDAAKKAVVIIEARGVDTAHGNVEVSTHGTGFFINSDGVIATSNHLRTMLGSGVDESTITYSVYLSAFGTPVPASFMAANPPADLLILYSPVQADQISFLRPVYKSALRPLETDLVALGYPNGFGLTPQIGKLTSFGGSLNPVQLGWTVNIPFNEGMSGGPVVTGDGRVAAVIKGVDHGIGLVIPVNYVPSEYWEVDNRPAATPAVSPASRVVVTQAVQFKDPRESFQTVSLTKSPCAPPGTQSIPIRAANGWSIVPGTATFALKSFTGGSLSTAFRDDGGARLDVDMVPIGNCVGGTTVVGEPAKLVGLLRFKEQPLLAYTGQEVVAESAGGALVNVPRETAAAKLSYALVKSDGTTVPFKPTAGELKALNGVLSLDTAKVVRRVAQ